MKNRKFSDGDYMHIYQRTNRKYNIFYSHLDYLVYFTIFSIQATKMGINVLELCLMIDHLHMLILGNTMDDISRFICTVSSTFVREYNRAAGRIGALFEKRFGSAPKRGRKKLVTACIYIGNNPVEKKICARAEQYRWNFIAYLNSSHPFSDKIIIDQASIRLRRAINTVKSHHEQGKYLNYALLQRLFLGLNPKEAAQLTDYIINKYSVLDKNSLCKIFGSYPLMLEAMHSTVGSEYEINEDFDPHPDTVYREMISYVRNNITPDIRKVTTWSLEEKMKLAGQMKAKLGVAMWQIAKFLHI